MVGRNEQGRIVEGGIEAQATAAFEQLQRILEAAGASLEDLVQLTTYLKNMNDLPRYRVVRDRFLGSRRPPSCGVQAELAHPQLLIEMLAVAVVD